MDKYGSLLQKIVNYMYQKFYNIVPLTLFYKKNFGRNLRIFVIS